MMTADSSDAPAPRPLLEAIDLVAGYVPEVNILNGCSLTAHDGELVGIIGPNGAGKSTLVKAIFGLVDVRSGEVQLLPEKGDDTPLTITNQRAHHMVSLGVGFVPQTENVFPSLTVNENLRMGAFQQPHVFDERVEVVLDLFPALKARMAQRAGSLSGGERQMVAMGRALMMEPRVLLLDEPSAGLSPQNQDQVFERVRLINESGVTVVMVEQNARRCLEIAHRGYVLDDGRNAYENEGDALLHDPKVIELYLGALSQAD